MGGGGPEEQARSAITDQGGVSLPGSGDKLFVTDSSVEVGDLLAEGVIEGITSGKYTYAGTEGQTGFYSTGFAAYTASGTALTQDKELGFLRSVYWNDVPVVDVNGYYNFADVNLEYVKGEPAGNLPSLNSKLPASETVDLTVHRAIGERLYGISTQGGTAPTVEKPAAWKVGDTWTTSLPNDNMIDAVAKTYTILNKECTSIEVKIKIPSLWEQIRNDKAPKKHEVDKTPPPVGYGDTKARSIEYFIYWQPVFDERFDGVKSTAEEIEIEKIKGTWEGPHSEIVTGSITTAYIRTSKIDLKSNYRSQYGFDGWRIKIIRVTPESLTSYLQMVTYVDSLTEIYGTKLRYPYSSMVYSKFNAEFFTRVPARSYDTKLLKVLIPNNYHPIKKTYGASDALTMTTATLATCKVQIVRGMKVYFENGTVFTAKSTIDAAATGVNLTNTTIGTLTGTLPAFDPEAPATGATVEGNNSISPATESTNFWDGGFRYTREWTDNPAWCFYDLLTNSRYGLGDYIDKSQVDKWALYEIAQYCDVLVPDGYGSIEPRFTINHIITSRDEAYKVLNDMASIFRGLAYYSNGLIFAVQDAYKKPIYQFNNANVTDGNFTYSSSAKKTRHSVALVRYIDRRNFFQPSVEYVENEEAIKRYGIRQLETTALGCTSRGQARRFGLWMLASEFQETESVSFSVGQDGGYLKPGDVLQLYDQNRTPLKFGGRTNAVLNTGVAPPTLTYSSGDGVPAGPVTGNSIIIDNVIDFKENKTYKFSLLTPTYYYDTVDIGDNLDSSEINQIRRSQIQDLYFYGSHAQTVTGYYRSDYSQGGSGIATQIYFHTGLRLEGSDPPQTLGSGNQLDFENYVITGYTNNYVEEINPDTAATVDQVSYSGGCFSGENLIWSLEPNDPADDEFISGNFSTYRVINVVENDDSSSYNVSALVYSSGKYNDVEGRLTFQSPNVVKSPKWPEFVTAGTAVYSALATVLKGHPNKEGGGFGDASEAGFLKYPTIEITFPQAGFDHLDARLVGTSEVLPIDPKSANPKAIRYLICVKRDPSADGVGFVDTGTIQTFANVFGGSTLPLSMNYLGVSESQFKDFYAPHQFKYIDGDVSMESNEDDVPVFNSATAYTKGDLVVYDGSVWKALQAVAASAVVPAEGPNWIIYVTKSNPYVIVPNDPEKRGGDNLHEFLFEFLATSDTSFWVAIFAVNNNTVSKNAFIGLIPGSNATIDETSPLKKNQIKNTAVFSTVGLVTINALSSDDVEPSTDTEIVELKTTEPSFSWTMGDERLLYDDLGNRLYIPSPYTSYRITIRKNVTETLSIDPIFIELTGYHSPAETANFTFLRDYNDPNMIESLVGNLDASGYKLNDEDPPQMEWISTQSTAERSKAEWFKVETSGVIFSNDAENFPLRDFELVVEAHDSAGTTSAGNKVWDNTIGRQQATETYADTDNRGWDIFAGTLAVPSGIVFATTTLSDEQKTEGTTNLIGNNGFLLAEQAYNRDYPYLATAAIYADGTLNFRIEESKARNGDVILNSNQISNSFAEVAGLVYYFTTGDSTLKDEVTDGLVTFNRINIAPTFSIDTDHIPTSIGLGNMAIEKKLPANPRKTSAVADTGATKDEQDALAFSETKNYTKGDLVVSANLVWKALQAVTATNTPPAEGPNWILYWKTINVSSFRGFALLEGQNPRNFTIPFPAIGDPSVTNIDLSLALFDKLSLSKYFESDGVTPKRETVTTLDDGKTGQRIPLIFTDKTLNLSRMPVSLLLETKWKQTGGALNNNIFTPPGDSIHLKELSVLSQRDGAGSYKSWFDFEIQPETDFIKVDPIAKGVYVGPQYAFNPDNEGNTQFLHRGFKSKNIKNITLSLSEDANLKKEDSLYWHKPKAPTFVGIDSLKIPEFAYLTVEFNEPIDPTKYWLNVDYNQTAGGNEQPSLGPGGTVKVSNSDGDNINSNIRNYVMEESNAEPNCYIMEKNQNFAKFFIAPFFSRTIPYSESEEALRQKAEEEDVKKAIIEVKASYYFPPHIEGYSTYQGGKTYLDGDGEEQTFGPLIVGNSATSEIHKGFLGHDGLRFTATHEFSCTPDDIPNWRMPEDWNEDAKGFLLSSATSRGRDNPGNQNVYWTTEMRYKIYDKATKTWEYQLMNFWDEVGTEGLFYWQWVNYGTQAFPNWVQEKRYWKSLTTIPNIVPAGLDFAAFNPKVAQDALAGIRGGSRNKYDPKTGTGGWYYYFDAASMKSQGTITWYKGGQEVVGPYKYHSTPELENYAWRVSLDTDLEMVVHNIRIQGGIMISDEYSAPISP